LFCSEVHPLPIWALSEKGFTVSHLFKTLVVRPEDPTKNLL